MVFLSMTSNLLSLSHAANHRANVRHPALQPRPCQPSPTMQVRPRFQLCTCWKEIPCDRRKKTTNHDTRSTTKTMVEGQRTTCLLCRMRADCILQPNWTSLLLSAHSRPPTCLEAQSTQAQIAGESLLQYASFSFLEFSMSGPRLDQDRVQAGVPSQP